MSGNKAPTTSAVSSSLLKPFCSLMTTFPSKAVCCVRLVEISGRTWTVATYKNVPALNNMAMPVVCISDRVSLLCCKNREVEKNKNENGITESKKLVLIA